MFSWKIIRGKIPRRLYLRNIRIDINGYCPFWHSYIEDVDHLFVIYQFLLEIWNTISDYCYIPIKSNLHFIDWIEQYGSMISL